MCLMTYFFAITKDLLVFKIYFKSLVFSTLIAVALRFEIVIDIKLLVWHQSLTPWSCYFFFKLSKYVSVVVFLFFGTVTNALATSWVCFSNTVCVECVFRIFWFDFPMVAWWKQTLTHVYFWSRMMLCFDDEKQKVKNTFKDNSQSEYFIY